MYSTNTGSTLLHTVIISTIVHLGLLFGYLPDWSSSSGEKGTERLVVSFGYLELPAIIPNDQRPEPKTGDGVNQANPTPIQNPSSNLNPGTPKHMAGEKIALKNSYKQKIAARLHKNKRYPLRVRTNNWSGTSKVAFTISAGGQVLNKKLIRSSGYQILDREALNLIDRCEPFPPIPPELELDQMLIVVPITFDLKK